LVAQLVLAGEWASSAHFPLLHQLRWVVSARWTLEAMAGTLNGPDAQRTHAVFALVLLSAFCVEAAMAVVAKRTQPVTRHKRRPRLITAALPATGVAVALTLCAGSAGVFALTRTTGSTTSHTAPQHIAAAPVSPVTTPAPP